MGGRSLWLLVEMDQMNRTVLFIQRPKDTFNCMFLVKNPAENDIVIRWADQKLVQ